MLDDDLKQRLNTIADECIEKCPAIAVAIKVGIGAEVESPSVSYAFASHVAQFSAMQIARLQEFKNRRN